MLDPDRVDEIAKIRAKMNALDAERKQAEASGDYGKADRLKDQIGDLDKRIKELQHSQP